MSHDPHADALFAAVAPAIRAMREQGIAALAAELPCREKAFQASDRIIRCIDEGTPGGLHFAGSGILASFDDAVAWMRNAGATGVTSHAHCGAAGIAAKAQGIEPDAADALGRAHAEKLALALDVPYVGHIERLQRPEHLHDAIVCYVDGTGSFDPSLCPGLPKGFVIDWNHLERGYALQEIGVAVSIALGSHGFGDRFSTELPFALVAVGNGEGGANDCAAIEEYLAEVVAKHDGRVVVHSLRRD